MNEKSIYKDYERLLEAARLLKGWEGSSQIADGLTKGGFETSPQKVDNWSRRGVSNEAKIQAALIIGFRIQWLETGELPMQDVTGQRKIGSSSHTDLLPLQYPSSDDREDKNDEFEASLQGLRLRDLRIPLITNLEALGMDVDSAVEAATETINVDKDLSGRRLFSILAEGSAMLPDITPGMVLVFDRDLDPILGDVVLASKSGGRPICRKLEHEGADRVLVPSNPQFKAEVFGEFWKILGVLREVQTRKRFR
jgi:SOS-response transcriptional repressor LexA